MNKAQQIDVNEVCPGNQTCEAPEPCQCAGPGWCERHRMDKADHLVSLCRTRAEYRAKWDEDAAAAGKSCVDWEPVANFIATEGYPAMFRCKDCGGARVAASIDELPKNRPCYPPGSQRPAPQTDCSCGGGRCSS